MNAPLLLLVLIVAAPSFADGPTSGKSDSEVDRILDATKKLKLDQKKMAVTTPPPAPSISEVYVADPWTDETRQRVYGWAGPPANRSKVEGTIVYESPLPIAPIIHPWFDPFANSDAEKIANHCKASFPEWWDRIGCVSKQVHLFFQNFKFDGARSVCRSHAQAFNMSFSALGLNRSWSRHIDASGPTGDEHVGNAVIVTDDLGLTFAYVIDSGWFPGKLFPQNHFAIRHHDRNGDGRTDFFDLPKISAKPNYEFRSR